MAAGVFETASVSEIAARAKSSVGTFYRLIGDKDELLRAVHDRFVVESRERIRAALDPALHADSSLEDVLLAFVSVLVTIYSQREGMLRALIVRSSTDLEFRERIHALRSDVRQLLGALVLPRAMQIGHADPVKAFAFAVKIVLATLNHAAVVASMENEDPQELARELTAVMIRYLEVR